MRVSLVALCVRSPPSVKTARLLTYLEFSKCYAHSRCFVKFILGELVCFDTENKKQNQTERGMEPKQY